MRDGVAELVSAGKKVVLVMHSAGGFTGSQAIEGLSAEERKRKGEEGGIVKLVYLTAALIPEGEKHPTDMPFMKVEDGHLLPVDPIPLFFNDIPLAEAERHLQSFTWQPANYLKHIHITYGAWKEIPSVYLFCEKDKVIPLEIQQGIAQMAGAETESCDAGHSVMLSQPERCVDVIRKAAGEML